MSIRVLKSLSEKSFLEFQNSIDPEDKESVRFCKQTYEFHVKWYGFDNKPYLIAVDEDNEILGVMTYNLTKNDRYITVINLLVPKKNRRKGVAKALMQKAIDIAKENFKSRLRMACDIPALPFYNKLGMVYWGIRQNGAFWCDIPLLWDYIDEYVKLKELKVSLLMDDKSWSLAKRRVKRVLGKNSKEHEAIKLCGHQYFGEIFGAVNE